MNNYIPITNLKLAIENKLTKGLYNYIKFNPYLKELKIYKYDFDFFKKDFVLIEKNTIHFNTFDFFEKVQNTIIENQKEFKEKYNLKIIEV